MLRKIKLLMLGCLLVIGINKSVCYAQTDTSPFYQITAKMASGESVEMSRYKGAVLLVVNTASLCGFTPQYKELGDLYKKYKDKKFYVLAFPSNDFAGQEPESNEKIVEFCRVNFGVTFQIFEKQHVIGDEIQPIFRFLTEESGVEFSGHVLWNFEKFLIDRKGKVRARYGSITNPLSSRLIEKLEELLAEEQ